MNGPKRRKVGALWAISQGLLTAVVPQLSIKMVKRMIGQNFENAVGGQYDKRLRSENFPVNCVLRVKSDPTDAEHAS